MGELIILWFSVRIRVGPPRISGTASPRCGGAVSLFLIPTVCQTQGGLESDIARHLQSSAIISRQTATFACIWRSRERCAPTEACRPARLDVGGTVRAVCRLRRFLPQRPCATTGKQLMALNPAPDAHGRPRCPCACLIIYMPCSRSQARDQPHRGTEIGHSSALKLAIPRHGNRPNIGVPSSAVI